MSCFLTATQAAELMVNGVIRWAGPRCDIVAEPSYGMRCLVCHGRGDSEHGFAQAKALRSRLREVIRAELEEFARENSAENTLSDVA